MNILNGKDSLFILKNPFTKDKINSISMYMMPDREFGFKWHCNITFKNDNTEGCQRFITNGADSFSEAVSKINDFIKNL